MSMCQKIIFRFYHKRVINIYSHNCELPNAKGIAWKCERLATNVCWQTVHNVQPRGYPLFSLGPRGNSEMISKIHVGLHASRATPPPTLSPTVSPSGQNFVTVLPSGNQTQPKRSNCFFSYALPTVHFPVTLPLSFPDALTYTRRTPSHCSTTQHDMLPQHLVCKYELNCEYCNRTLARNKTPWWWSDKIETSRSYLRCFKVF